ncbi:unnamed protein product, partial [Hapterophycus canaliculatus]
CLDAFLVALCQTHEDKEDRQRRWYVSTLDLQLVSLEFCIACRSVPSLHVRVVHGAPPTLWAPRRQEPEELREKPRRTRVPVVRAARLTWRLRAHTSVRKISWPAHLEQLSFGSCFDNSIAGVAWPASLQHISFGYAFNQPIAEVLWPPSLQQMSFGQYFNQPLVEVEWPASLQQLSLGNAFNQPITGVAWPPSLQQLSF